MAAPAAPPKTQTPPAAKADAAAAASPPPADDGFKVGDDIFLHLKDGVSGELKPRPGVLLERSRVSGKWLANVHTPGKVTLFRELLPAAGGKPENGRFTRR
jgi:hypothetical protein